MKDIDPSAARKEKKLKITRNDKNTFKAIALEWFDNQKDNWCEGHAKKVWRCLERNAFPYIGTSPIGVCCIMVFR